MPIPLALAALAATTAAAGGSSWLSSVSQRGNQAAQSRANKPYLRHQERKNKLIDDLLASLDGGGKYGNLFKMDEASFQKSFVDPAKARFNNQIAPQIQQQSIYGGTDNSSNVDDQLLRAGVDMDQLLNQNYMQYQTQAQDRMQNVLNSVLGTQAAAPLQAQATPNPWADAAQGILQSPAIGNFIGSFGGSGGGATPKAPAPLNQAQIDLLNPQTAMNQNAANYNRQGFTTPNNYG